MEENMSTPLKNKSVAFLATDGVEQSELTQPWEALKKAGAQVTLVSLKPGEIQGMEHSEKGRKFKVDKLISDVTSEEFDALVLPGGVANPDALRMNKEAVSFAEDFMNAGKPVAAICHGPWLLVEAGVLKDRTLTSYHSIKTDIINAGGNWVDKEVCVDNGLVTSRTPEDLDAFCRKTIEEIAEGKHHSEAA